MCYRAVIFDLDGTLLNTLTDLAEAMNRVLSARGHSPHPVDSYRYFVGNGAAKLVARALTPVSATESELAECLAAFREAYRRNWNKNTRPYAGVLELLEALREKRLPLAVLTNKPQAFAERCVREYFDPDLFVEVRGQREGHPLKPDPSGALDIARRVGVPPRSCLYLGDSNVDMQTAVRAGMFPAGVAWGFRPVEELHEAGAAVIINLPGQILDMVE